MRPRRWLVRDSVLLGGVLLGAASCSVIFDTDQVQCEIPDDCAGFTREAGVKEVACVEGICTFHYLTTTTGGTGGTGGDGGSGNNTTNTTSPSSGGSGATSNTTASNTTSSAGSAGAPGCQTNDECIEEFFEAPAICRDGECIPLYSDECPVVVGADDDLKNLRSPKEPIIFGAYSSIGATVPENSAITANYEFAINQVNDETGGGVSVAGARHPFVAVVCNYAGDISASMTHLVKTLKVPAVITTLGASALLEAYENPVWGANQNNVFLLSALDADSTLTNQDVDTRQLMWHMLGEAADWGVAYKPLVAQAEALVRAEQGIPEEEPIRVAMVVARIPPLEDIANVVQETVEFNGLDVAANGDDGNFIRVNVDSSTQVTNPDLGVAFNALRTLQPHIVLAIASNEFFYAGMLPALEGWWDANQSTPPPFYLLSPYIGRTAIVDAVETYEKKPVEVDGNPEFIELRKRLLGVLPAAAEDTSLYDDYLMDFKAEYRYLETEEQIVLDGKENFYDAAYFAMYAIHGGVTLNNSTGVDAARGMKRLLGGPQAFDVGDDIPLAISALRSDEDTFITLNGTLGPPDFNGSGARKSLPSVYCIDLDPEGTEENQMAFYPDVLKYNDDTELLEGPDPCSVVGFMENP